MSDVTLRIDGMHCAGCVAGIENGVSDLEGVASCRVNLATRSGAVAYDPSQLSEDDILRKIDQLGYRAEIGQPDLLTATRRAQQEAMARFRRSILAMLPLMFIAMWPMFADDYLVSREIDGVVQMLLAGAILFVGGKGILADAARQTIHGRANMNSLIAMGTLTAFGWSLYALLAPIWIDVTEPVYFESAGMIITLILLGRYLESRSQGKASDAIRELMQLQPDKTLAVINGVEVEVDIGSLKPGMTVLVRPGERIPADGLVADGRPTIDQSMVTGETMPVEKDPDDEVIGGTLNGTSSFRMTVVASGEDSLLAGIIRAVSEAQSRKAPVQRLADRVAGVFVPIVLGIAAVTAVVWYLTDGLGPSLVRSTIAVMIVACPCALGLATPTAILAATGRAARNGILIRGGDILERLNEIDTVMFDKTGTLTDGELEVVGLRTFDDFPERSLLRLAGSAERHSEHTLARAIVHRMESEQIKPVHVRKVEARPGFGLLAEVSGQQLIVGNRVLMRREKIELGAAQEVAEKEMDQGRTVVFVALDGRVVGLIMLLDRLRVDARDVILELRSRMSRVTMLSGDTRKTAAGVARTLGLEHFEAGIRPEQKSAIIESLRKLGSRVAMVGDGINDAPALAAANVGIAVGSGTDVALETADVVLVRSDLSALPHLFNLANSTLHIIRQNLFWAFFYNVLAIPLAAGAFYPWFGWSLSPVVAAAAMSLSSLFVVSNSLRLGKLSVSL